MGSRYLLELEACARATGAPVHLEPGWQTRGRGSGGFNPGLPSHVMTHHTASGVSSDGQSDVDYCCYVSENRPIANLYLSRAGEIWVMAAGATNTNGAGHDWWGGGVPDDQMNVSAVGIEAANGGTGEPWPTRQQEVYALLVRELRAGLGIPVAHVRDHEEWAGARKCDITGPARWAPAGNAQGCSGAPKWSMDSFRADQSAGWPNGAPSSGAAVLLEEGQRMHYYLKPENEAASSTVWISDGTYKWSAHSQAQLDTDRWFQEVRLEQLGADRATAQGFSAVLVLEESAFRAFGYNVDPWMTGRDPWGWLG